LEAALAEERSRLIKAKQDLSAAEAVQDKLTATLPHYRQQDQAYEKLVKDGFAGPLMGSDKRRERIEKEQELKTQLHVIESARASTVQSEKKLAQIETDYRRQLHAERNETQAAVDKLGQEIAKQTHRKGLLELKASQNGVVKDLATHTTGTVVQPGTVMLTLVPQDESLRAEVWVAHDDIGFVHAGQTVKLKFAAFSFQKYGMAEGVVEHVSADAADGSANSAANNAAPATDTRGRSMPLGYKALVTLKSMRLDMNGERFKLAAGMQTNAEILLGTRTVVEYLLSPVQQAWHEAARER
jgi:HlyD family secretion protein